MTEQPIQQPMFQVEVDENQIAIIRIHSIDNDENWLPENFAGELREVIGTLIYRQVQGAIFISTRANHFIQGLKPSLFKNKTNEQLLAFSQDAQAIMRELNTLKMPIVAAIDGNCFSVGLELSLACDYRIASDESHTFFAMPQVRSGLLPFAGGTQRLPRLIGLRSALPLMLFGEKITAETAKGLGLVDRLVPKTRLLTDAYQLLLEKKIQKANHKKPLTFFKKWRKQIEGNSFLREKLLDRTENAIWLKTFGNYPAVAKLMELLKEPHFKQGLMLEQQAFVELFNSATSQVLIELKKTERAMKDKYRIRGNVRDVAQVSILGSGYMGAGIAYLTANNAKVPVRIKDIHPSEIRKALRTCFELMQKATDKNQLNHGEMIQRMNLITGGERLVAAKSTDFVIEAVYEDLKLKQRMLAESESYYSEQTIFATNTSTFAIKDIAACAIRPENVIGLHYFSPVTTQKMVEIIPHSATGEHTIATAIHFAIQQGKIPLLVADKQGFFINRVLTPLLLEAVQCLIDGESIEFIDRSLQEFGFKLGPLAMIDEMGLDVLVKSNSALVSELGSRFSLPQAVDLLFRNERKGCKNKRGFYMYDRFGERLQEDKSIYHVMETIARNDLESEQIVRRCLLRMLNEAAWCLQDKIIASTDEGNVASVLAMGFPEFRGGIYAYIEKIGAKEIVRQLHLHTKQYGKRFEPCEWLIRQAEQ
ncbi:3-hydroxyacyl-CoA dehydrogenase NAD-binding domain-containing protein [Actinobacillus pleuropneumoniae]|uniref:3-hydroxyacyl-CoA dehydrogenase NAD-binding domain-containing protein n=1 Tax=Actinobacillus pleuropneumoniae TaxID=715 RepID=UPI00223E8C7D|nr:3-hydroxyacyl-CoA dehydrogenase NAD-binding domain-containing protein [Actinobacillus pleuropneumoniae]MCY6429229.1 3-hydroxyacyl-CoA dehydrogenase NAD-binding domain-containing protein [Actinobacillus pleuropneumoniae]